MEKGKYRPETPGMILKGEDSGGEKPLWESRHRKEKRAKSLINGNTTSFCSGTVGGGGGVFQGKKRKKGPREALFGLG